MDNKKVIGGLALGIVSVLVLGLIFVYVIFGKDSAPQDEPVESDSFTELTESEEYSQEENTAITEETTDEPETTEEIGNTSEAATAEQSGDDTVYGVWEPVKVIDGFSGEEVSFSEAFGNDFYELENRLELSEDGTFELALGTIKTEAEGEGSFLIAGDSLEVTYGNGSTDIFKLEKDMEGGVEYILVPKYNFTVYFQRA